MPAITTAPQRPTQPAPNAEDLLLGKLGVSGKLIRITITIDEVEIVTESGAWVLMRVPTPADAPAAAPTEGG